MKSRRKAREAAVQALYQCDTQADFGASALERFLDNFYPEAGPARVETSLGASQESEQDPSPEGCSSDPKSKETTRENRAFAALLMRGASEHLAEIDASIEAASAHWTIQRMSRVDRNILRVAAFELKFLPDVPPNVIINEAIEIAKTFGSDESPNFINGVLDQISKRTSSLRRDQASNA
jgi:N utilization substance protein B